MKTITLEATITNNGNIVIKTENRSLSSILNKLIEENDSERETLKYVKYLKYTTKFGNPAFTFEFYNAETIEEAILLESMETSIQRNICDFLNINNEEEYKQYLKKSYDEKYHEIIEEEISKQMKKLQEEEKHKVKIDIYEHIRLYEASLIN